eukprot:PhF_6_TR43367/c1_g1_i2/m.66473
MSVKMDVFRAVKIDDVGYIRTWVKTNDPNITDETAKKSTPLHWAAFLDSKDVALALLNAGANKNAKETDMKTPLHCAAFEGNYEIVVLLLQVHADYTMVDKLGKTPCELALMNGHIDVARLFPNFKELTASGAKFEAFGDEPPNMATLRSTTPTAPPSNNNNQPPRYYEVTSGGSVPGRGVGVGGTPSMSPITRSVTPPGAASNRGIRPKPNTPTGGGGLKPVTVFTPGVEVLSPEEQRQATTTPMSESSYATVPGLDDPNVNALAGAQVVDVDLSSNRHPHSAGAKSKPIPSMTATPEFGVPVNNSVRSTPSLPPPLHQEGTQPFPPREETPTSRAMNFETSGDGAGGGAKRPNAARTGTGSRPTPAIPLVGVDPMGVSPIVESPVTMSFGDIEAPSSVRNRVLAHPEPVRPVTLPKFDPYDLGPHNPGEISPMSRFLNGIESNPAPIGGGRFDDPNKRMVRRSEKEARRNARREEKDRQRDERRSHRRQSREESKMERRRKWLEEVVREAMRTEPTHKDVNFEALEQFGVPRGPPPSRMRFQHQSDVMSQYSGGGGYGTTPRRARSSGRSVASGRSQRSVSPSVEYRKPWRPGGDPTGKMWSKYMRFGDLMYS